MGEHPTPADTTWSTLLPADHPTGGSIIATAWMMGLDAAELVDAAQRIAERFADLTTLNVIHLLWDDASAHPGYNDRTLHQFQTARDSVLIAQRFGGVSGGGN